MFSGCYNYNRLHATSKLGVIRPVKSQDRRRWLYILLIPELMQLLMGMSMSCMFDPAQGQVHISCIPLVFFDES